MKKQTQLYLNSNIELPSLSISDISRMPATIFINPTRPRVGRAAGI